MRRIILLSTVLFATPLGIESYAADCATTSCQTLGYTATSNKGNCLQCPFGNYWFCPKSQCDSSYKYTCTGTFQSPSGTACNGKYRKCNCSNNYVWNASQGRCLAGSGSGSSSGGGTNTSDCVRECSNLRCERSQQFGQTKQYGDCTYRKDTHRGYFETYKTTTNELVSTYNYAEDCSTPSMSSNYVPCD